MSEKESAKPIAYRFKNNRGNGRFEYDYYDADEVSSAYRDNCIEITPLYTAPQSAELDALRSQVAALREALDEATEFLRDYDVQRQAQRRYQSLVTDTEAAAKEYERELRNRVLEEAAKQAEIHEYDTEMTIAYMIRAMKETP